MVALIAPNGARVDVAPEKAERLLGQGWQPAESEPAAKKPASRKAPASKSE